MSDEQEDDSTAHNASSSAVTLDGPEPTQAALAWYSAEFHRHATNSALEIAGRTYLPSLNEERRLYRTVVPPSGAEWSPCEKDLFFAALVRHSRLRPDLIARDVPGKSESQVLWYLDELDRQSQQLRRTDGRVHGFRDRLGRWGVHRRRWIRGVAPAAREVEPSWIEEEEKLSAVLLRSVEQNLADVRAKRWAEARQAERDEIADEAFERSGVKYRNRWKGEKDVLASLEERWSVQDWGDPLDDAKMEEVDALLARPPSLPKACAPGTGQPIEAPQDLSNTPPREAPALSASRGSTPGGSQAPDLGLGRSGSKLTKIATDRALKARIMAIPRQDRTPDQRKALSVVLNRERMRIRTRTQKLLAEGWTEARIDAAGGADAVIDKRLEEKEAANQGRNLEGGSDGHESSASPNASPRKRRRRKSAHPIKEEDEDDIVKAPTETDVEIKKRQWRIWLERYLAEEKLDVFNYSRMTELARLIAQRDNDVPALSWDIIERLRDHLMAYLVPIMYQVIAIAEARLAQGFEGSASEDAPRSRSREPTAKPDDRAQEEDGTSDQINVNDVMLALASTGTAHPGEEIRRFWRRQVVKPDLGVSPVADDKAEEGEKEDESGDDELHEDVGNDSDQPSSDEGGPVRQNDLRNALPSFRIQTKWPKSVLPPSDMPWHLMPCVQSENILPVRGVRPASRRSSTSLPRRTRSNAVSRATSVTGSPPPSNYVPSEDETLPSDAETTLTDEEEKKRDELLDRVDALWDVVLGEDLEARSARDALETYRPVSPSRVKPKKGTKRKRGGIDTQQGDEHVADYDDPWRGSLHLKRLGAADSSRGRSQSRSVAGGVDESEDEESEEDELCSPLERAKEARDRYARLLLRISKKRRDRHSRLYQQSRFAALRLRGRAPDSAWYVSSDDESDPDADAGVESAIGSAKRGRPRRSTEGPLEDAETSEEEVSWAGGSDRESLPDEVVSAGPAVLEDADIQPGYQLSSGSEYAGSENDS